MQSKTVGLKWWMMENKMTYFSYNFVLFLGNNNLHDYW